jgi:hypothetical protein
LNIFIFFDDNELKAMASNQVTVENSDSTSITVQVEKKNLTWQERVTKKMEENASLVGVTCCVYSKSAKTKDDKQCACGRLIRRHSFNGQPRKEHQDKTIFNAKQFLDTVKPLTAFGQLGKSDNAARVCFFTQAPKSA